MSQEQPVPIKFANRISARQYQKHMDAEWVRLHQVGVLQAWQGDPAAVVVNGLGVVPQKDKVRVIVDCRYINAWVEYQGFAYESLHDMAAYLQFGDHLISLDMRSGYHHFEMHPDTWCFLAMEWKGQLSVFTHLPFGVSSACLTYTRIMRQVISPFQQVGLRLTHVIDDLFLALRSLYMADRVSLVCLLLFTGLGFFISQSKSHFMGQRRLKALGFMVDTLSKSMFIPEQKVVAFKRMVQDYLNSSRTSPRRLARLIGQLVSFRMAARFAPLFMEDLYGTLTGVKSWDAQGYTPIDVRDTLLFWQANIVHLNGRRWRVYENVITVVGDASDRAYAAYLPDHPDQPAMQVPFSVLEVTFTQCGLMGSTLREVRCVAHAVRFVIRQLRCQGVTIKYIGDNQGSIQLLNRMGGKGGLLQVVGDAWLTAAAANCDLVCQWHPRTEPDLHVADEVSKRIDSSDINLHKSNVEWICQCFGLPLPDLDVFAGAPLEAHHADRY